MALIDTCPLCGKHNCFETIDYTINGIQFNGIKCTNCNAILYSAKKELEASVEAIKERFEELSDYPK